jgi:putative transposase
MAYIDMNMVRAGVVDHPGKWECCGYNEIQNPPARKGIIDFKRLMELLGFETYEQLKQAHFKWVNSAIQAKNKGRQAKWTQSVAVGGESFIEKIKEALGFRASGRKIRRAGDSFELRETQQPYGTTNALASGNTFLWDQ